MAGAVDQLRPTWHEWVGPSKLVVFLTEIAKGDGVSVSDAWIQRQQRQGREGTGLRANAGSCGEERLPIGISQLRAEPE